MGILKNRKGILRREAETQITNEIKGGSGSFQKSAGGGFSSAQFVVQGIIQGEQLTKLRRKGSLSFRAKQTLLILLLRLVKTAVEAVEGPAMRAGPVGGASVPGMRVHDGDASGGTEDEGLIGVRPQRVSEHVLRKLRPVVRAGNDSGRAVFRREIVEQPDGIAYPKSVLVGEGSGVTMQRLRLVGIGIRRAGIKAAEFESLAKNVANEFENAGRGDEVLENFAFVDQIRKPPRTCFLAKLQAGIFAFQLVEFFDALPYFLHGFVVQKPFEDDISGSIQALTFCFRHKW